jgi:hypothetical protein
VTFSFKAFGFLIGISPWTLIATMENIKQDISLHFRDSPIQNQRPPIQLHPQLSPHYYIKMPSTRYPSAEADSSALAQPLSFPYASKKAQNRFLKAAMSERLCSWSPTDIPARGIPSKELINLYRRWGEASIGTILTEI